MVRMGKVPIPYEEARMCPRCGESGEEGKTVPVIAPHIPRGTRVIYLWCRTAVCPWYSTNWPVQVYPDGTVYVHDHANEPKEYTALQNFDAKSAAIEDALAAQMRDELSGDGEIRRR